MLAAEGERETEREKEREGGRERGRETEGEGGRTYFTDDRIKTRTLLEIQIF